MNRTPAALPEAFRISGAKRRIDDILKGTVWAAMDTERRQSKRQKDLADIARILEVSPQLRREVPSQLLSKLL
jgi:hypothetical protein